MPTLSLTAAALLSAVLLAVLALAVWFDVTEKRLPNWLTAGGLLVALALRASLGTQALQLGILGGAAGFSLGILLFAAGAMGAGDGKLLATVGAFLGWDVFLLCLPLIGAFGGVLALGATIKNGTFLLTIYRFRELLFYCVTFGRIGERRTLASPGAITVPYGVAVAAGAAMAWMGWGFSL